MKRKQKCLINHKHNADGHIPQADYPPLAKQAWRNGIGQAREKNFPLVKKLWENYENIGIDGNACPEKRRKDENAESKESHDAWKAWPKKWSANLMQKPKIQTLGELTNGWRMGIVNGNEMRTINNASNDSFVGGGNYKEESKELPRGALVSEDVSDSHWILAHELYETLRMDGYGETYEEAHAFANSAEKILRNLEQSNIKKYGCQKVTLANVNK